MPQIGGSLRLPSGCDEGIKPFWFEAYLSPACPKGISGEKLWIGDGGSDHGLNGDRVWHWVKQTAGGHEYGTDEGVSVGVPEQGVGIQCCEYVVVGCREPLQFLVAMKNDVGIFNFRSD